MQKIFCTCIYKTFSEEITLVKRERKPKNFSVSKPGYIKPPLYFCSISSEKEGLLIIADTQTAHFKFLAN
ncbi:unnamed protein product, partial [Larinioides sclopetarius]